MPDQLQLTRLSDQVGTIQGEVSGLQLRVAALESKTHENALSTGQWKLEQVRGERDALAEANRHWARYVIGVLVTVVILLSGAGLGILLHK